MYQNKPSFSFKKSNFFSRGSAFDRSNKEVRDIVKIYPDFIRVIKYKTPTTVYYDDLSSTSSKKLSAQSSLDKSIARSRSKIRDYVLCNDFTHFGTITFDPRRFDTVDLTDIDKTNKILTKFINIEQQNHIRKFNTKFGYLIVPEQHKSGVYHYHILLSGYNDGLLLDFFDKSNKFLSKYEKQNNADGAYSSLYGRFFFMPRNYLGRNQFERIHDKERVASYILKYITKDLLKSIKNKKRFMVSRGLKKPVVLYNVFDDYSFSIPNTVKILKTDFFHIYEARGLDYDALISNLRVAFYKIE